MTPTNAAVIALIVAILVLLAMYYWGNYTIAASLLVAAVVGLILQIILFWAVMGDMNGLAAGQIAEKLIATAGLYGLMILIYVLIILIIGIIYATRDKRLVL